MKRSLMPWLCFLLLAAAPCYADFYRWVDKDGKEFFTNDPKQVPQEYRDRATTVKPDESRVSVGEKPAPPARPDDTVASREHRDKNGHGEEYWRKRAANYRLKLRNQQDEYDLVLKQLDDQDQKPKKIATKKKKTRSSLEKKKLKIEKDMSQTRRMLEVDLPEEARRADAYPGWLRE
ncbi:MAG TPA: DUF4124 domain-containing protein [Nitrospirota bacterium]|nr:DUF4124 domain-containing protein [Nitrospirota bacterium]